MGGAWLANLNGHQTVAVDRDGNPARRQDRSAVVGLPAKAWCAGVGVVRRRRRMSRAKPL
jgi:hypothetical protein